MIAVTAVPLSGLVGKLKPLSSCGTLDSLRKWRKAGVSVCNLSPLYASLPFMGQ